MILLLGAGASKYFGVPTTFELPEILRKAIDPKINQNAKNLWSQIKDVYRDKFDLEVLLTVIDDLSKPYNLMKANMAAATARFIIESETGKKELESKCGEEWMKKLSDEIRDNLRSIVIDAPKNNRDKILQSYDNFLNLLINFGGGSNRFPVNSKIPIASGPISFFSTNYDTCVESYFYERKIDFSDGMVRRRGPLNLDVKVFESRTDFELIKMHGSINWFMTPKGEIVEWPFEISNKEQMKRQYLPFGEKIEGDLIIYPTETGGDRRVMQSPYADFYHLLRRRFSNEHAIFIVGFSLREQRICGLLDDIIRSSATQKKVILIDPGATEIKRRVLSEGIFKVLGEAISPADSTFEGITGSSLNLAWSR